MVVDGLLRRLILPKLLNNGNYSMSTTPTFRLFASYDNGKTFYEWKQDQVFGNPPTAPPDTSPPITDKKLGTIVPLYTYPNHSSWAETAGIAKRYPRIHVVATVNPNSGPGSGQDPNYINGIRLLKNNAVTVLGYVATGYGGKSEATVKAEIDRWKSFYPDIDGIFFDEMTNTPGKESYYNSLDTYVKSKGMTFTVGNPGAPQIESYFANTKIDNIHIYENQGYPSVASMKQAWMSKYPRSRFGVIPYAVANDTTQARNFTNMVAGTEKLCGYVYIQTDVLPNPWDSLSPVFEATVMELDRVAAAEGVPSGGGSTPAPPAEPTPTPRLTVTTITASGSQPNSTNTPDKVIDNNPETRWSNQGASWIQADLGKVKSVNCVGIAWYRGDERRASFSIRVSKDGAAFTEALPMRQSSGRTESLERYSFTAKEGRYVRVMCNGTDTGDWNSIIALEVYGNEIVEPAPGTGTNPPTTPTGTDRFGIKMLYPTVGGKEWYVNMTDPRSSERFRNLPTITKQPDGSFRTSASQVRLEAWSPENNKWLNVEITGYAKVVSGSATYAVQQYSRGGHHYSAQERWCEGSAMKGRFYLDGRAAVTKEVNHPAYCSNRGVTQGTTRSLRGRWIGLKTVIYNYQDTGSNKTFVAVEQWIDDDVNDANGNLVIRNGWKKVCTVRDTGGWGTNDTDFRSNCPRLNRDSTAQYRARDEILNTPGGTSTANLAAWRTDGTTTDWKFLSVREIQPPTAD